MAKKEFMVRITESRTDYEFVNALTREEAIAIARSDYFSGSRGVDSMDVVVSFESGPGIEIADGSAVNEEEKED